MIDSVVESIEKLDDWLGHNGWAGYDPYDILEYIHSRYRNNINLYEKFQRRLLQELDTFYPWQVRRFLKIQKKINAKAMGLFVSSYVRLYEVTKEEKYLYKARDCLNWLNNNYSKGYAGKCWGYPFDWQCTLRALGSRLYQY